MKDVEWLAQWYADQCDGEWEHDYGVHIETLDNPGWRLRIDLAATPLASRTFTPERFESDAWVRFWCESNVFHAAGGPMSLPVMIGRFRQWATENDSTLQEPPRS